MAAERAGEGACAHTFLHRFDHLYLMDYLLD
jgi:hypothetical protein